MFNILFLKCLIKYLKFNIFNKNTQKIFKEKKVYACICWPLQPTLP